MVAVGAAGAACGAAQGGGRDHSPARKRLGRLLSREEGKTLAEGIGETVRAAQIFDFFAGEALRLAGETVPSVRPGVGVEMTREAVGVVGIITPWNFPIAIPAWKIAPALCYGNTVVFKPADLVPGCSWAIVDILHRAGLPKGVLNLVMGKGSVVGQAILDSPDVNAITFTGSVGTGKRVAAASVEHMRKFQLEMGGKNPLVVLDDADLGIAVDCAVNGAFFSTGQRCTASSRLIVQQGIHDKFVAAVTEKLRNLVVDNALKAGTQIGPVVDESQLEQDKKYIAIGREEGAKLVFGGERLNRETPGFYLQPALFTEEFAGPIEFSLKRRRLVRCLLQEPGDASHFGLHASGSDDCFTVSVGGGHPPTENHVVPVAQRHVVGTDTGILGHWQAFASEGSFGGLQGC